jgi:3',5'-cyclic AMP phosphodiesterase CpdA
VKRMLLGLTFALCLAAYVVGSAYRPLAGELVVKSEAKNPWNHLNLNNDPQDFQFIIVSDRTGGHRANVFSKAVEQINLLQPEFVISVGDLIEGYSENRAELEQQWQEFNSFVARLKAPFFYAPGNHDVSNSVQTQFWNEQYGRNYYHFIYRNVLFLMLNSEDPPEGKKGTHISPAQVEYVKKTLADNAGVRWTIVCLHKPMWTYADAAELGWTAVEKALNAGDRPYTVFCGHVHRYEKWVRNGRNFYQLATTGGGSKLRGVEYGEFDHIAWVTMKKDGPLLCNICLDGILSENLTPPKVSEPGVPQRERQECLPVRGRVYYNGKPAAGARVVFYYLDTRNNRYRAGGDALVDEEGGFTLSTYRANDGAPPGDYQVAISWRDRPNPAERGDGHNKLPAKYANPQTSGLSVGVKAGSNDFLFDLKD